LGSNKIKITESSIRVSARGGSYLAIVGEHLLSRIGKWCTESGLSGRCAIVCDTNLASLFFEPVEQSLTAAGSEVTLITVPPGEKSKSLDQVGEVVDRMATGGLDRSSFVIGLGGGVVGDLAGFVAAIYHRGIPYVQVPTTLLAQVDSAIGGKTAVNIAAGKNLIGVLHHPVVVIADVDLLRTLPEREFNQGFAEIIKHAIIRDASLFEEVAQLCKLRGDKNASWKLAPQDLASLVRRNIEIKAEFVSADERDEKGKRALLNFGHTVGHAIEQGGDYRELLHGEAVSLGMVAACDISVRKAGLPEDERAKVIELLRQFDLPTRLPPGISREKILRALPLDKKFERGEVRFVVTPGIGSARLTSDVTMEDIREAVMRL
jgi:3-dehydroquinate synthase